MKSAVRLDIEMFTHTTQMYVVIHLTIESEVEICKMFFIFTLPTIGKETQIHCGTEV